MNKIKKNLEVTALKILFKFNTRKSFESSYATCRKIRFNLLDKELGI